MKRTLLFAAGGLLLAGIVHIAIVFLVPLYASRDAWAAVNRIGTDRVFVPLPRPAETIEPLASLDPRMLHAVCRFSLGDGPVRIRAALPDDFWSVAIFDRRGRNAYSLNDRAAERSELDLALITPLQMARLRADPPASLDTAIVVELPISEGFAVLRIFVAADSRLPEAESALASADCAGAL